MFVKKISSVLLVLVLVFSFATASVSAANGGDIDIDVGETDGFIAGDVDGNGSVSLLDVTCLAKYVAGWQNISYVEAALDPNGDGRVSLIDVTYLAQHIAGWSNRELSKVVYVK